MVKRKESKREVIHKIVISEDYSVATVIGFVFCCIIGGGVFIVQTLDLGNIDKIILTIIVTACPIIIYFGNGYNKPQYTEIIKHEIIEVKKR